MGNDTYRIGLVGLQEHETLICSCLLSIHSKKWSKPWEVSTNGSPHAVLYDLSSREDRKEWQQAQAKSSPVAIAYTPDMLSDVQWRLKKPSDTSALIELLKDLTVSLEKKSNAVSSQPDCPVIAQPVENANVVTGSSESSLWGRIASLAERHQAPSAEAKEIKLILGGSVGAGKTTALRTISEIAPIHTEARASDIVRRMKSETTVAMDYGECTLPNGKKTSPVWDARPGQIRVYERDSLQGRTWPCAFDQQCW